MSTGPEGVPAEVYTEFERVALALAGTGWRRYSADAILHRIRWHMQVERGQRDFKVNNNWSAPLARWFAARNPEHDSLFETRQSVAKAAPIRAYAD